MLKTVLHVGCGPARNTRLPLQFQSPQWQEVRLDLDPAVQPDIVGNIADLAAVGDASVDAIWSSHNLEHLHAFEVPLALAAFKRVLKNDGFALITVPDLRAVARHLASDQPDRVLYESAAGPIRPLDILFGHQASLEHGNHFMAHRTGFSAQTLGQALVDAAFAEVRVFEGSRWDLWALAVLPDTDARVYDEFGEVML